MAAASSRPAALRMTLLVCAATIFVALSALGVWQVKRLSWKLDLIERVALRRQAPAIRAPVRADWPGVTNAADSYRHVTLQGTFLYARSVKVQAVTDLGPGYWLLTPLRRRDDSIVLINRGFVTAGYRDPAADPVVPDIRAITGLLRMSEPGGAFLRHNDATRNRWYSRDVSAIATAQHLTDVAPYFVDADIASGAASVATTPANVSATADNATWPIGGLTVVSFSNNHLVYAITWFTLALMVAGAMAWVVRDERSRRGTTGLVTES